MANYDNLISAIKASIKPNGTQAITGQVLQDTLLGMVSQLGKNYAFGGVATPSTNPGTPTVNTFYIATEAGTYTNMGDVVVADGEWSVISWNGATWTKSVSVPSLNKISASTLEVLSDQDLSIEGYYTYRDSWPISPNIVSSSAVRATPLKRAGKRIVGYGYLGGPTYTTYNIYFWDKHKHYVGRWLAPSAGVQAFDVDVPNGVCFYTISTLSNYSNVFFCASNPIEAIAEDSNECVLVKPLMEAMANGETGVIVDDDYYSSAGDGSFVFKVPTDRSLAIEITSDDLPSDSIFYAYTRSTELGSSSWFNGFALGATKTVEVPASTPYLAFTLAGGSGILDQPISVHFKMSVVDSKLMVDWRGKTFVCFGDSNVEFADTANKRWSDYVEMFTGANIINVGVGGTQLRARLSPTATPASANQAYAALDVYSMIKAVSDGDYSLQTAAAQYLKDNSMDDNTAIVASLSAIDWSKVDGIIIFAGTNDAFNSPDFYGKVTSTDPMLAYGAMNGIVQLFLSKYPTKKMYFCTPIVRWNATSLASRTTANWGDNYPNAEKNLKTFCEGMIEVARNNKQPILDLYTGLGWNTYNFSAYFNDNDGAHPRKGYEAIARKIVAFIASDYVW